MYTCSCIYVHYVHGQVRATLSSHGNYRGRAGHSPTQNQGFVYRLPRASQYW